MTGGAGFPGARGALAADVQSLTRGAVLNTAPLWPADAFPARVIEAWSRMSGQLSQMGTGWEVWIDWYNARLRGEQPNIPLEVARVLIADGIWDQGPPVINAEIKRLIGVHGGDRSADGRGLKPLEDVPSAFGFAWSERNTVILEASSADQPSFPFRSSLEDHARRLETSRVLAEDLASDLEARRLNVRDDYQAELRRYAARLPHRIGEGNVLLADAAARTLRDLFAAEADLLPAPFASRLKTVLEQHIGLRAYYPEIAVFYRDVRSGRLEAPLPLDAVEGVIRTVRAHTPGLFDPSVQSAIGEAAAPAPVADAARDAPPAEPGQPAPPPDPLGELEAGKSHDFQAAGVVNKLWQVFEAGEKLPKAAAGWRETYDALAPHVEPVLEWLHGFLGL